MAKSNRVNTKQTKDELEISGDIKSTRKYAENIILDRFLKKAKVNLSIWKVDRYQIGSWDVTMKLDKGKDSPKFPKTVTNYNIKVWLKKEIINLEESLTNLVKTIPLFQYSSTMPMTRDQNGIALEIATLDAHFGKLAWLMETGYRNYDTKISLEDYAYVTDKHLQWSSNFKVSKIYYIIGQDIFHIDNMEGRTTNGEHSLDVDGRITKIQDKSFEIIVKNIYACRAVAPVEIIWSPGNHDYLASYMLCFALKEHFRKDEYVTVDIGKNPRKARLWGNLLVGWTHRITGRYNNWGNELAQAFPELWSKSIFREWHHGDQHKKQDIKSVPVFTSGGVLCRQLTALSPVDRWHFDNLFTDAIPGGESFLWSASEGIFANFIAWTGQYEKNRDYLINKE